MKSIKVLMVVALMMVAGSAFAQATDDQVVVTADVLEVCSINAPDLDFGNYDPTAVAPLPGTSPVTLTCNAGSTPILNVDYTGSLTAPVSGDTLTYTLTPAFVSSASNVHSFTLDGEIAVGQFVTAEAGYTETVTLLITF